MKARIALAVVILAAAVGIGVAHHPSKSVRCTEDMSCWDCRTMGNRICGEQSAIAD